MRRMVVEIFIAIHCDVDNDCGDHGADDIAISAVVIAVVIAAVNARGRRRSMECECDLELDSCWYLLLLILIEAHALQYCSDM